MSVTFVTLQTVLHSLHGVTLRYIDQKSEFLNSFVSLIWQRYIRYIFTCVCKSVNPAFFKDNNNKAPRIIEGNQDNA